jgi:hypothetical protein
MRRLLTGAAMVLALAGTSLAITSPAAADGVSISFGNNRGHDYDRNRSRSAVSFTFGDVAFGYRDGYWDNNHRWHRWNNSRDHRSYRSHRGGYYRDWNHDRNGGDGWARDGNVGFNDIAFGYRDGYWDSGRQWHRWSNDRAARNYRSHNASNYRDWNHDRDGHDGWDRDRKHRDNGRRH